MSSLMTYLWKRQVYVLHTKDHCGVARAIRRFPKCCMRHLMYVLTRPLHHDPVIGIPYATSQAIGFRTNNVAFVFDASRHFSLTSSWRGI